MSEMSHVEFAAFLDLLVCSDPWPVKDKDGNEEGEAVLKAYADRVAVANGFTDWINAYHKLPVTHKEP